MSRLTLSALLTAAALAAVGCAGTYSSGYGYGYGYYDDYYDPELVYLSPGVSVVAGYDYPVFRANDYYWRYHNNRWFRSRYYDRGWVYASPPRAIARIDRPYRYRNYRPYGYTVRRNVRPSYRDYRDHRRPVYRDSDRRYRPVQRYRQTPQRVSPVTRSRGRDIDRGDRRRPVIRDRRR